MGLSNEVRASELLQAEARIWNHAFSYVNSMSLKCVVQLGIPHVIHNHGKPMTLSEVVDALHIQPSKADCISRLMRLLIHSGFFAQQKANENEQDGYILTPISRLLLKDEPLRAASLLLPLLEPAIITPWNSINSWFQNSDSTPFETTHGKTVWDYMAHEPTFKKIFFEAMLTDSNLIAKILMQECQWVFQGLTSLVDVGGGLGAIATAIADAFPSIKCTVFDLPHVVADLQGTENLEFIGGDMFEAIPPANAVLLKWILHDWNDEKSLKILKLCKEAIFSKDEKGKLIIIDIVLESQGTDKESTETQFCIDLLMMVTNRGKERTENEWKKPFLAAGFTHYKITPIMGLRSLIEVYP